MIDEIEAFTTAPIELELSGTNRAQINHVFQHWFAATAKRSIPDLEQKIADFQKSMSLLALSVRLKYTTAGKNGVLLAEASGVNATTLSQMKLGTLWFDGWRTLEQEVMCVIQD